MPIEAERRRRYAAPITDDIQGSPDARRIAIQHVGVRNLRYPICVLDRVKERQHTVGTFSLSVDLPHEFKGTHMSRFVEALNEHRDEVTVETLPELLQSLQQRLQARRAHVEVQFPYFIERRAPQTGAAGLMNYECEFEAAVGPEGQDLVLKVSVPVTSLCPCSKTISDYGAHNQRGNIDLRVRPVHEDGHPVLIWLEELIEMAEASASAPVYALLKRPDERHVTMQAYDNPVFVEDMVRNVAQRLMDDPRVAWFDALAENHESIHNHDAFARIEWER
jgi:GTP cyclohydrolase I